MTCLSRPPGELFVGSSSRFRDFLCAFLFARAVVRPIFVNDFKIDSMMMSMIAPQHKIIHLQEESPLHCVCQ